MPRIRTLKPEILEDEKTGSLSDGAFRLFASVILLADDHGNCRATTGWLVGQIWWARENPPRVAEFLRELSISELVQVYSVRGQLYVHITNWTKHQRIDNAGKARVPGPEEADSTGPVDIWCDRDDSPRDSASLGETPLDPDLRPPITDPEKEKEMSTAERPISIRRKPKVDLTESEQQAVESVLTKLTKHSGVAFRASGENAKLVVGRLRDGIPEEDLRKVITYCALELKWEQNDEMRPYLRPITLFGPRTIAKYLDPARSWAAKLAPSTNGVSQ